MSINFTKLSSVVDYSTFLDSTSAYVKLQDKDEPKASESDKGDRKEGDSKSASTATFSDSEACIFCQEQTDEDLHLRETSRFMSHLGRMAHISCQKLITSDYKEQMKKLAVKKDESNFSILNATIFSYIFFKKKPSEYERIIDWCKFDDGKEFNDCLKTTLEKMEKLSKKLKTPDLEKICFEGHKGNIEPFIVALKTHKIVTLYEH